MDVLYKEAVECSGAFFERGTIFGKTISALHICSDYGPAICVHLGRLWLKIMSTYMNQFAWPAILNVFDM